jgi:hypothetical protein
LLPTPDGVLLGSDSGLYRLRDRGWQRVLARGAVRDLARAPGETLIATAAGLYGWADGAQAPRSLGLGAGARVTSVAVADDGRIFVGTQVGLFSRGPDESGFARELGLPAGAVVGVRSAGGRTWAASSGQIWVRDARGEFVPEVRGSRDGWWELRGAVALGRDVLLTVPRGVWRVGPSGAQAYELGADELRGVAVAGGTGFFASDRGVLPLDLAELGSSSAAEPLGGDSFDVASEPDRVLLISDRGLAAIPLVHRRELALRELPSLDPSRDLALLHRAVLRYQGLSPAGINRVEERARTAAFLPELRLGFTVDRDRDRARDLDEVFTSGVQHELRDHGSSSDRSLGLSLQMTWDLDTHRDPDRAIAVSRERRELVELRDQVLERVNRLYFERARVLAQLAAAPPDADVTELGIRAQELTGQLDAWTGGVFSKLADVSPRSIGSSP